MQAVLNIYRFNIQNSKGSMWCLGAEGSCGVFVYQFADLESVLCIKLVCVPECSILLLLVFTTFTESYATEMVGEKRIRK